MSTPDSAGMMCPRCPNCGVHYMGLHTCGGSWPLTPHGADLAVLGLAALSEDNRKRIQALEFALRRILAVCNDPMLERICREALEGKP